MSPRAFDSDKHEGQLWFHEQVDCPVCDEVFLGEFVDQTRSLSVEDMVEPPIGSHKCPACGEEFISELSGWVMFGEAG
jgi:hypothetical protein